MNQKELILNHLRKHKTITPLEALRKYGCFRLGARIYELKVTHNIEKIMVRSVGKNKTYFAQYSLV